MNELINEYKKKKKEIVARINEFKKNNFLDELIFCILTPQSNAKMCWEAVEEIKKIKELTKEKLMNILRRKTRFYRKKTDYVLEALNRKNEIENFLKEKNVIKLRFILSEKIKGFGLKEASHFLRNIGRSKNNVAILDRHILKNLKNLNVIEKDKIKSKRDYLDIEEKFIDFSKKINVPLDHLDLLFWCRENGTIFK